jgi:hypothetical protein
LFEKFNIAAFSSDGLGKESNRISVGKNLEEVSLRKPRRWNYNIKIELTYIS